MKIGINGSVILALEQLNLSIVITNHVTVNYRYTDILDYDNGVIINRHNLHLITKYIKGDEDVFFK